MNSQQLNHVIESNILADTNKGADYLETLNSWIIRTNKFAYKIRKPIQINGWEIENAEQQKNICLKELQLNKSVAGNVYQDVIPIQKRENVGEDDSISNITDYALKMKRLAEDQKVLGLLKNGQITTQQLKSIVLAIVKFQKNTEVVRNAFSLTQLQNKMEEIKRCEDFVYIILGREYTQILHRIIAVSKKFLSDNRYFMQERTNMGFIRNGHGNLSASSIFLRNGSSIITNRIVLPEDKRNVDVLYDVALFGVDLDYYNYTNTDLNEEFLNNYLNEFGDTNNEKTRQLYTYYKFYRLSQLIIEKLDIMTIFSWTDEDNDDLIRKFRLLVNYIDVLDEKYFI